MCKDVNREKDFVCKNCGCKLEVWQAQAYCSFDKEQLKTAEAEEDFAVLFEPAYTAFKVQCTNCHSPELSDEDANWLEQFSVDAIEYLA